MRKFFWSLFEVVETVAIAVIAVILIRTFIAQPFLVSGSSMEPNFKDGDYLLVDELSYRFREPARGEIIVFKYPGDHKAYYIKRIIGLPGERVVVQDDSVTVYDVDGKEIQLVEPYISGMSIAKNIDETLTEDEYFVMGDNRDFSYDSRSWGPLTKNDVTGLVKFRLWPVSAIDSIKPATY
jgi:signal peptidase I